MCGVARLATGSVLAAIVAHLSWRAADLVRDLRVAGTIDPLVTSTYPYPSWSPSVLIGATTATVLLGFLLTRFGREGGDERQVATAGDAPPPPPKASDDEDGA